MPHSSFDCFLFLSTNISLSNLFFRVKIVWGKKLSNSLKNLVEVELVCLACLLNVELCVVGKSFPFFWFLRLFFQFSPQDLCSQIKNFSLSFHLSRGILRSFVSQFSRSSLTLETSAMPCFLFRYQNICDKNVNETRNTHNAWLW